MENIETIKESEIYWHYCFYFWEALDKTYSDNKELIDNYRPNATTEVQKIIDCYNKNLGCSLYECPHCHDIIFVAHTCKARFCSSCGYKYKNDRLENILQTAYNCNLFWF